MISNSLYNQTILKVALYKDKETRDKEMSDYYGSYQFEFSGINYDKPKAYEALKKRPEFEGAIDS